MNLNIYSKSVLFGIFSALTPAFAAEVTLTAADGSSTITGEFISFEGGFYTIGTSIGQMRLSSNAVSCSGADCPQFEVGEVDATIVGSGSVAEGLMTLLIAGYADSLSAESDARIGTDAAKVAYDLIGDNGFGEPVGSFLVESRTAAIGFDAMLNNEAEIVISSRRIHKDEARALRNAGAGNMVSFNQEHVLAVDSLLIIVNQTNPINSISLADVEKIYNREITNWSQLGGPNQEISVHSYGEESDTWEYFDDHVLEGRKAEFEHWVIEAGEEEMAREVNLDPFAIGYVGQAFQRGAKALEIISSCGITSSPDAFSAKTEDYPLERRIYAYTREKTSSVAADQLLEFAASPAADGVIGKAGFIGLDIARNTQSSAESRMEDLLRNAVDPFEVLLMRDLVLEMLEWDRLSSTFRFGTGSSRLDNKAELDMIRLIDYLETQQPGTQVSTVGFTDSDGAFSGNRALSESRAAEVYDLLKEHAGTRLDHIEFVVQGYGELSPTSCNDSSEGKSLNRRVEIWIRNT